MCAPDHQCTVLTLLQYIPGQKNVPVFSVVYCDGHFLSAHSPPPLSSSSSLHFLTSTQVRPKCCLSQWTLPFISPSTSIVRIQCVVNMPLPFCYPIKSRHSSCFPDSTHLSWSPFQAALCQMEPPWWRWYGTGTNSIGRRGDRLPVALSTSQDTVSVGVALGVWAGHCECGRDTGSVGGTLGVWVWHWECGRGTGSVGGGTNTVGRHQWAGLEDLIVLEMGKEAEGILSPALSPFIILYCCLGMSYYNN